MTAIWNRLPLKVRDVLERALSSSGQQFLAVVIGAGAFNSITGLPWVPALSTAAGAGLISLLLSAGQVIVGLDKLPYAVDLLIRVGKTFAASLLATLGDQQFVDVLHVHWITALNIAAVASFLALVKGLLGPHTDSASLLRNPPRKAIAA